MLTSHPGRVAPLSQHAAMRRCVVRAGPAAAAPRCAACRSPARGAPTAAAAHATRCVCGPPRFWLAAAARGRAAPRRCSAVDAGSPHPPPAPQAEPSAAHAAATDAAALPPWVVTMNAALERAPVLTLLCFVALDIGSALCLWAGFEAVNAAVDADFALAYALSKAVRVQRLALDAAAAGALARAWPALAAVRVSRLVDAAAALPGRLASLLPPHLRMRARDTTAQAGGPGVAQRALSRTAEEARRMADAYGLAYMAAKNVIGPVSIVLIYAALRQGLDVQAWLAALGGGGAAGGGFSAAGRTAGRMALASWTSIIFFPAVVLGAAHLALATDALLASWRRRAAS